MEQDIKVIAMDLDGTALNHQKQLRMQQSQAFRL